MISHFVRFSDSASDDEDGDGEAELLDSDEDEIDENGAQYLEKLEKSIHNKSNGTIEVHVRITICAMISWLFIRMYSKYCNLLNLIYHFSDIGFN